MQQHLVRHHNFCFYVTTLQTQMQKIRAFFPGTVLVWDRYGPRASVIAETWSMASGATQVITKARGPQRGPVIAPWADRKSRTSTRFVIWQSLGSITALVSFSLGTVTQEKPSAKHSNGKTCTSARRRPDKSLLSKKQINKTQKLQYMRPHCDGKCEGPRDGWGANL